MSVCGPPQNTETARFTFNLNTSPQNVCDYYTRFVMVEDSGGSRGLGGYPPELICQFENSNGPALSRTLNPRPLQECLHPPLEEINDIMLKIIGVITSCNILHALQITALSFNWFRIVRVPILRYKLSIISNHDGSTCQL